MKINKLQIQAKDGAAAYLIFDSQDIQKRYIKAESKFCKKAYIDYICAFTKAARADTLKALSTQRRLFAATQQYAPSMKNRSWWIYKPNKEDIKA